MNLTHLSKVDRAGARRVVRAWKMDQNTGQGEERYQNPHRDITGHAHYFHHLKTLTPEHRRRLNRYAKKVLKERDAVLEAAFR